MLNRYFVDKHNIDKKKPKLFIVMSFWLIGECRLYLMIRVLFYVLNIKILTHLLGVINYDKLFVVINLTKLYVCKY